MRKPDEPEKPKLERVYGEIVVNWDCPSCKWENVEENSSEGEVLCSACRKEFYLKC